MDEHIESYFQQYSEDTLTGNFHRVIAFHREPDLDWKELKNQIPSLPRGWYELVKLDSKDRIEFVRDFWISKLPYHPLFTQFLTSFFDSMDDIGVFATQKTFDDPLMAQMVYSIRGNNGYYRGNVPASEEAILELQNYFTDRVLPKDYIAFLQIHSGFSKTTDCTGIIAVEGVIPTYDRFQNILQKNGPVKTVHEGQVNPKSLLPFYESFGMPYFQCFWSDWYPLEEMGNVYFSGVEHSISDTRTRTGGPENLSFPTFLDWLKFYLERIA